MNPKQVAAEKAVEFVEDGMIVGLGTGSTAFWATQKIAQRISEGLTIRAVASSASTEALAGQLGIPLVPFSGIDHIDITIDGADEVDDQLNLIKGGGGALLREKILARNSSRFYVVVDETKRVHRLGRFPLPVEIVPFASNLTIHRLQELNCEPVVRMVQGSPFITDNGNLIVDCSFKEILNPVELQQQINLIPGVVENGLFVGMPTAVVVGYGDGTIQILEPQNRSGHS
ncbi:ribose-5-phosphate isomerase RpiA [Paenibacillus mesotrionivorans]|uniref:Ribose-5-phosphate isomerase RpiA n=1 Tax=Paenibacillus mesotrionivorans TaxID=3160968 RepID=A0ACC7NVQ5_9BACL